MRASHVSIGSVESGWSSLVLYSRLLRQSSLTNWFHFLHLKVFVLDTNRWTTQFLTSIAQHNGLSSRIKIIGKSPEELVDADLDEEKVDVVVSDMWFQTLSLPWDGLYYSYALRSLQKFLKPDCVFLPRKGELKGMCLSMRVSNEEWWCCRD